MAQRPPDGNVLIDHYLEWIKTKFSAKTIGEYCEITTPLLDSHNDYFQIYVKSTEHGLLLTDDGYVINDLSYIIDLNNPKRKEILNTVINRYGIKRDDDELYVEATLNNFAQKKHNLIQAMIAVNDIAYTSTSTAISIFTDEVASFLDVINIPYTSSVLFNGKSGLAHSYDFIIPRTSKSPSKAIKAIQKLDKNRTQLFIFACNDTKQARNDNLIIYPIVNDTDKPISQDIYKAFNEYDIDLLAWSNKENIKHKLAI
jgi:hypothetical protein